MAHTVHTTKAEVTVDEHALIDEYRLRCLQKGLYPGFAEGETPRIPVTIDGQSHKAAIVCESDWVLEYNGRLDGVSLVLIADTGPDEDGGELLWQLFVVTVRRGEIRPHQEVTAQSGWSMYTTRDALALLR